MWVPLIEKPGAGRVIFLIGFICFLINQASSQATSQEIPTTTEEILSTTESETIGEESVILTSPGYPTSYLPTSSFKILRKVEPGYQIDIKLNDLDLSVKDGDYLSISSEENANEASHPKLFYGPSKLQSTYRTESNLVVIQFVVQERKKPDPIKHRGFKLELVRSGILTTSTIKPTTEASIPEKYREYIKVYIEGSSPEDFVKEKVSYFIDMLVNMAKEFCAENLIPLEEEITHKNIDLQYVTVCPITWPNNENCLQIRYAIPISLEMNEKALTGTFNSTAVYELSLENLSLMWDQYSKKMLSEIGLQEFTKPNLAGNMGIWLGVSLLLVLAFCGLLIFLWKNDFFGSRPISMRRLSDDNPMETDFEKPRISDGSLYPSQHQLVPPLFDSPGEPLTLSDNYESNTFKMYEPEFLASHSIHHQDVTYGAPPGYATRQDFGTNLGFINDEEQIVFDRSNRQHRSVTFDDDSKL